MYSNFNGIGVDSASTVRGRGLVPAISSRADDEPDNWDDEEFDQFPSERDDSEAEFDERIFDPQLDANGTEWQWMPGPTIPENNPTLTPAERAILPQASQADPADVTDLVIEAVRFDDVSKLWYWAGTWWSWSNGRYTEITLDQVRTTVTTQFKQNWSTVRSRHVSDVIEHLRAELTLPPGGSPPMWIKQGFSNWKPRDCLATRDSIVHLPSLVEGEVRSYIPATPALFTTVATEFSFEPDAAEPFEWFSFLDQLWGEDQQSIDTLQEMFGLLLTQDTRYQKIFALIGPRRSGKGTIARILRRLVGEANVAGPTLSGLATNFGLESLLGKSLAVVSDMRLGHVDRSIIVERLLAISGEDKLTIDRKHKPALHLQLPARFLLISNELPRLDDVSATIVSRMIVLSTSKSFFGSEDLELENKLVAELPGILLWAITGWERLRDRGRFEQPEVNRELIDEMNALASPISAFVNDRCLIDPAASVVIDVLYEAYTSWREDNGWEHNSAKPQFCRELRAVVPGLSKSRPGASTDADRNRPRVYTGIGLRAGF
jgi:putative DNA primase/helicase